MASYADLGMSIAFWYAGLVFFCFYMANRFSVKNVETAGMSNAQVGMSRGFSLFFTGIGMYTILLGFAMGQAIFTAESINGTVGGILQTTYQVFMWVFIVVFFFLMLDFLIWLFALLKNTRMKGRVV
jgi:vancomycin resistance protein YoaR